MRLFCKFQKDFSLCTAQLKGKMEKAIQVKGAVKQNSPHPICVHNRMGNSELRTASTQGE